jgi:hypothetical protein
LIVDFHCHAGESEALTAPWTTDARLAGYERRAAVAGIQRTVLVPTFPADSQSANRALAAVVRRRPDQFVGFAWVHPRRDARWVDRLVDEAVRLGLRGLKIHGSEATPTRAVCRAACRHRLPVLVDVVGRPWTVEMFATRFPQVDFVIAHLGSFADDWRAHRVVIDQLARLPNVYSDTSGVRRFDYLVEAVARAGPHKLLFGSDGPFLHPGLELAKIRLLELDPRSEALIMGGNAMRLLRRGPVAVGYHAVGSRPHDGYRPRGNARAVPIPRDDDDLWESGLDRASDVGRPAR